MSDLLSSSSVRLWTLVSSSFFAVLALAATPLQAATITVDAPGCTNGGTLTWDAASKTVYCTGTTTQPASILAITGPDCAAGTALAWNATSLTASCQARIGAMPSASLNVSVSLPDCVNGAVSWNATTKTLTCRRAAQGLNIDGSTTTAYDSLTDGLMVLRYLFGLRGAGLTANALSPTATRTEPVAIAAYLDSLRSSLDIDNNGVVDALTDGTLILRYMFGTRGSQLLAGAIGPGAANATAAGIEAKIRSLMP